MDHPQTGCSRRAGLGCLAILGAMFVCIASFFVVTDFGCYNTMTAKLPMYPNAQVVTWKYNMFRAFGIGETLILLNTDDTPDVVRDWYGRTVGAVYQAAQQGKRNDPFFFLASARYTVTSVPNGGTGSQILLSGVCAS